jgi:hypothetical protein
MFTHTDTEESPWWVVEADSKTRARLNCMAHLLSSLPWEERPLPPMKLPERPPGGDYRRPPRELQHYVPDYAAALVH